MNSHNDICAICKRPRGDHNAVGAYCPVGRRTRAGQIRFHKTSSFILGEASGPPSAPAPPVKHRNLKRTGISYAALQEAYEEAAGHLEYLAGNAALEREEREAHRWVAYSIRKTAKRIKPYEGLV